MATAVIGLGMSSQLDTDRYLVQQGDNLTEVAEANNTTVRELVRVNRLTDPNFIMAGRVIRLREAAAVGPVAPPASGAQRYVVRPGDTLSAIARRVGVSQHELARANGLKDHNLVFAGSALALPGAAAPA
ncbi:MAG: LysM peptidoglycan-binding domain-containing protein, partial [Acidimicrobiales bacterium]